MVVTAKNNKSVLLRKLTADDFEKLYFYLQNLSSESKRRFGPHPFNKQAIAEFYLNDNTNTSYIAECIETNSIIGYSIIKTGYLEHDAHRFKQYGIQLNKDTDCTLAPSVADDWQNCGVGSALFKCILEDLKSTQINRIILWAGVQAGNTRAVIYYYKHGFEKTGEFFDNNGANYDMYFNIP